MQPSGSMIEVGGQDSMTKKFSTTVKSLIFLFTLAVSIVVIFSISILKNNPYLTLRFAQMQGEYFQLKYQLDLKDVKQNIGKSESIPVLMYHGLNNDNDGDSVTRENFKNQMFALKKAGWQTITLDQMKKFLDGATILPRKSFMLTFEDGRKDSYFAADPILHALNYNAIMFVITDTSLVKHNTFHLDKQELKAMERSGRWDIQSHGKTTHSFVVVDEIGTKADFYSNKKWLFELNRLESEEEFLSRIRENLQSSKKDLEKFMNKNISSISFPFGGGNVPSNYSESEAVVLSIAKDIYPFVLHQYYPRMVDGFTGNYSGKNVQEINRLNAKTGWNTSDVISLVNASGGQNLPYNDKFEVEKKDWVPLAGDVQYANNRLKLIPEDNGIWSYLDGTGAWENYSFKTKIESGFAKNVISLLAYYNDAKNYVSCEFRPDTVAIKTVTGGESIVNTSIKVNRNYQYKIQNVFAIDVSSSTVKCFLNDEQLLVAAESTKKIKGGVGLKSWNSNKTNDPLVINEISVTQNEDKNTVYSVAGSGKEVIYKFLDEGKIYTADQMRRNVYTIDRYKPVTIKNITWKENPYNEQYWRFMFYSLQPTRNLLAVWEKTGNDIYLYKLKEILNSYLDNGQNGPYAWDLHGTAFRTMVLTNTYKKLEKKGKLDRDLRAKLEKALVRHGNFLLLKANYEGEYNHGIDQSLAMYVLAVNFPKLDKKSVWKDVSTRRLVNGLNTIIDSDGILIENSPYYHFYVLDKYWQFQTYLKQNKLSLGDVNDAILENKIKKMVNYATYILQPDSTIPLLGASLAGTVNNRGIYAEIGNKYPQFLYAITQGVKGEKPNYNSVYYPTAGQTIFRSGWSKNYYKYQSQVIFDVGSYRTDHSDLDALSFTLFGNGVALLPDSGLYTYESGPYREYFHGTRGHNTVVVDGASQLSGENLEGDLIDAYHVEADKIVYGKGYVYQSARHTLYPGVTHNRTLVMLEGKNLIVIDRLYSKDKHTYEQMFHTFPGAKLEIEGTTVIAKRNHTPLMTIRQLKKDKIQLSNTSASKDPVDGLCSSEYEVAIACNSLAYKQTGTTTEFISAVTIGSDKNIDYEVKENSIVVKMGTNIYSIDLNISKELDRSITVTKAKNETSPIIGKLIDDFTNINGWTADGDYSGVISIIGEEDSTAENYMKISLPLDGTMVEIKKSLKVDMTKNRLVYDIAIENWSEGEQMEVQISNKNWSNFATYNMKSDIYPITFDGEWVKTNIAPGEKRKVVLGNWYFYKEDFDWSQVDGIRFRFRTYGTHPVTVKLKNLTIAPIQDGPKVVIIFDDGWSSILEAAEIMKKYDLKGNVGVVSTSVGKNRYLSVTDLKLLQNTYGWNVVNHSSLHKAAVPIYYETGNLDGLAADIEDGIYFLEKNEINTAPNWYIYPNGSTNRKIEEEISKLYVYARSTNDAPEAFPFVDPYAVKVFSVYSDRANTEDTVNAINDAMKYNQSLFMMFHKFSENNPKVYTEFSLEDFEDIISYIAETGIKVYTLKEYDQSHSMEQSKIKISERIPEKLDITVTPN